MKNKAPLALMELVIMILIFALAAALCLQAFQWASEQSQQIALRDDAVLAVQNMAEALKASGGDAGADAAGLASQDCGGRFRIETTPLHPDEAGLGGARVRAVTPAGEELFAAEVYWQEPLNPAEGGGGHE